MGDSVEILLRLAKGCRQVEELALSPLSPSALLASQARALLLQSAKAASRVAVSPTDAASAGKPL